MTPAESQKISFPPEPIVSKVHDSTRPTLWSYAISFKSSEKPASKTTTKKAKTTSDGTPKQRRPPKPKKSDVFVNSDSDLEFGSPKKSTTPKVGDISEYFKSLKQMGIGIRGCKSKKTTAFDNDSDVDIFPSETGNESATRQRPGRARKEVKYFAESDDDDFAMF
ncbi:hypothetical protein AB205_0085010 [Aquarana catesbeiana]|uniref:DTHCT domain-containing protein n=1 Tax=Aquarana catesbeiana TaxID=8400 RepID=A0A2G9RPX0_AQUCT|nr:hypothetical protein AB205_0085010 [Aquarana catesbeiana]